jgi:hypothetical protein
MLTSFTGSTIASDIVHGNRQARFDALFPLHTFGEYLDFRHHIRALVADGLLLRSAINTGSSNTCLSTPSARPGRMGPQ